MKGDADEFTLNPKHLWTRGGIIIFEKGIESLKVFNKINYIKIFLKI